MSKQVGSASKKRHLLRVEMGNPRPSGKTHLGAALVNYTGKSKSTYDFEFDKAIRSKQPGWFVTSQSEAARKAWKTRRANEEAAAKWTLAGKKAWVTRRRAAAKRSNAAKKAWRTIRANA